MEKKTKKKGQTCKDGHRGLLHLVLQVCGDMDGSAHKDLLTTPPFIKKKKKKKFEKRNQLQSQFIKVKKSSIKVMHNISKKKKS